jgi:hypothetical protein
MVGRSYLCGVALVFADNPNAQILDRSSSESEIWAVWKSGAVSVGIMLWTKMAK